MKSIKLNEIHITQNRKGKGYFVHLGNGISRSFDAKKDAMAFIGITNAFLDTEFQSLLSIYKHVSDYYNTVWMCFESPRSRKGGLNLFLTEQEIADNIQSVSKLLHLIMNRSHHVNGNYFVFIHFNTALELLENTLRTLAAFDLQQSRNHAVGTHDVQMKLLLLTQHSIKSFAKTSTARLFKLPNHISMDKTYTPDFNYLSVVA